MTTNNPNNVANENTKKLLTEKALHIGSCLGDQSLEKRELRKLCCYLSLINYYTDILKKSLW